MYHLYWLRDGVKVPSAIVIDTGRNNEVTVRSPDPYDQGERVYQVDRELLRLAHPTHEFIHSSMMGSYRMECAVLRRDDVNATILFIDPVTKGPEELSIPCSELETLETPIAEPRHERLMKLYAVSTPDDLIDAMERHILRLKAQAEAPTMRLRMPSMD